MKNKTLTEIQLLFALIVMVTGLLVSVYIENIILNELSKSLIIVTGLTVVHISSFNNPRDAK
ncbi:hypothetical protein [Fulvivirga kasyanovii]|uniref:Uncharacterized protein n=1 Tax=Fulvivirga kasyanovii TaxID=396812 RepID=A0ABW9RL55_9BACT|nr:hypothetical protein [Fulvivirga kasyanovii]MTI24711.1 hypothetical protein [Fulvivirga kasyanovii]